MSKSSVSSETLSASSGGETRAGGQRPLATRHWSNKIEEERPGESERKDQRKTETRLFSLHHLSDQISLQI